MVTMNQHITLRPWQDSDAPALYRYASDPDVGSRAGWQPHQSEEESRDIIRTVFNNDTTWAIVLKDDTNTPIGAIGYGPSCDCSLPARAGEPTVGYWIGKPYWNKGYCTEALRMVIEHARRQGIPSLISGHYTDNPASGRVMEKCGFVPTGEVCFDTSHPADAHRPIRVLRMELQ